MRPDKRALLRRSIEERKRKHEHTNKNIGHEKTESGLAGGVGGGATRAPRKEKKLTDARDALAAERRRMPWLVVEKEDQFDGPQGKASLLDLFDGRRQLIVYRAFLSPA